MDADAMARARRVVEGGLLCQRAIIGQSTHVDRATLERPRSRPKGVDPLDVLDPITIPATTIERFWAKVDRSAGPDACWPWTAAPRDKRRGYGGFAVSRRTVTAHRLAYALGVGAVPAGAFVCHRCDNPPCCNPAHLFLGTSADNVADRHAKGRDATGDRTRPETRAKGDRNAMRLYPEMVRRGELCNLAKLTDVQAADLLRDLRAGMSYRDASALYGVSYSQAYRIDRGTRRARL